MKIVPLAALSQVASVVACSLSSMVLSLTACNTGVDPAFTTWEGTLLPEAHSDVTGSIAAATQFGGTTTSIQIAQAEFGIEYGWRIETGTCAVSGIIQGGSALYPLLIPDEAGSDAEDTNLPLEFKADAQLSAKVFRSTESSGEVIVACGMLHQID